MPVHLSSSATIRLFICRVPTDRTAQCRIWLYIVYDDNDTDDDDDDDNAGDG